MYLLVVCTKQTKLRFVQICVSHSARRATLRKSSSKMTKLDVIVSCSPKSHSSRVMLPAAYRDGLAQFRQQLSATRRFLQIYGELKCASICHSDCNSTFFSAPPASSASSILLSGSTSIGVLSALSSCSPSSSSVGRGKANAEFIPRNLSLFVQSELSKHLSLLMRCVDDKLRTATSAAAISAMFLLGSKSGSRASGTASSPANLVDWSEQQRRILDAKASLRSMNRVNRCIVDLVKTLRSSPSPTCILSLEAPGVDPARGAPFAGLSVAEVSLDKVDAQLLQLARQQRSDEHSELKAEHQKWLSQSPKDAARALLPDARNAGRKGASSVFAAIDVVDWLDEFVDSVLTA